ncbi:protein NETWORKED 4A-like [Mangifera indica]|uniref:protein NETWORKED 4A-like n=1 Tax=Mangifera indica TaxID=29780 RepID=UPI001CFC167C|nr:protein NETWORKED 4A-like [Mangifera indica]XP_044507548.1 protein NETWORKED 4A-like [Mangifera indica]
MGQSLKQVLKLIEDGESLSKEAEAHWPEFAIHIQEFYHLYQSLAERYDHFTGELQKIIPSDFQMQISGNFKSGSSLGSPLLTPDQKLILHNSSHQAASFSSGRSSDFSMSSSDTESEYSSSIKFYSAVPGNLEGKGFHERITELGTKLPSMKEKLQETEESNPDSFLELRENARYKELLGRVIEYEEKLRVSNLKLQLSEEEVAKLKNELHAQTESVKRDIELREAALEMKRIKVLELENYTFELETCVSESKCRIEMLMQELEVSKERLWESDEQIKCLKNELANEIAEHTYQLKGQLELAQEDVAMLKASLDSDRSQVLKLKETIAKYECDLSDSDDEIQKLKVALNDVQENFSLEKAQLQCNVARLLEKQTLADAGLKELDLRGKVLEDQIKQCENEKMEMKGLHETQQSGMQSEISQLKVEVAGRASHIEALNKNLDSLKLKYDMLMAEKDELNAKINTLRAEVSCQDDCIRQKDELLQRVRIDHARLIARAETTEKVVDELRVRVKELEKEVDEQRNVILDGAEEKREAIRQLCFSLEHYRSGYIELRQAFIRNKKHQGIAA